MALIPTTSPGQMEKRRELGLHITECDRTYCNGFLGPLDTYSCICWCHEKERSTP